MKKVYLSLVIALLCFSFFSCSEDSVNDTQSYSIVGKWEKPFGIDKVIFDFSPIDGNGIGAFSASVDDEGTAGTYKIEGQVITFNDPECEEINGRYSFEVNTHTLEFTLIVDDCEERAIVIAGTLTRAN